MDIPWLRELARLLGGAETAILIVSILLGLLWCFFGYRLFKVILGILGFILGAIVGAGIGLALSNSNTLWAIVGAVVGGIIGSALLVLLYFIGIFLLGAAFGALLGTTISSALDLGTNAQNIILIALAIVGGVLALVLQRVIIIVSTSFSGAWSAVTGAFSLAGIRFGPLAALGGARAVQRATSQYYLMLAITLALAVAGMLVQFLVTGKKKPAAAPAPPAPSGTAPA